jgi:hypothetical protein
MERAIRRKTFDCRNRAAVGLNGKTRTRLDGNAIEQHRAGTALARVAADLCSGHAAKIANEVHQ